METLSPIKIGRLISFIRNLKNIKSELAEKVIIWFILKSEYGTKKIAVSIYPKNQAEVAAISKLAQEVLETLHDNKQFINKMLASMESEMCFSQHVGMYMPGNKMFVHTGEIFDEQGNFICNTEKYPVSTIWLSTKMIDNTAELLELNMTEINAVELYEVEA